MKKVFTVLIVLLLLVGGAAWYFVTFRMDTMIEHQIEAVGATSLGAAVSVGQVRTSIKDGSLSISNVTVPNPPGFRNKNAFSLNNIEAAVDYGSLEIKRLVIEKPEIIIEEMGGETNISRMMKAMDKGGHDSGSAPSPGGEEEPVIVIRHFRMNKSRAAFESESLDRYTDIEVDAVEMNDLKGTPSELSKVIARRILKEVTSEAATELMKAQAKKQLDRASEKVSDKLKGLLGSDEEDSGN